MNWFLVGASISLWFVIGLYFGHGLGRERIMQEAYERGHAVQCVGKTGYYWSCDHD